MNVKMLPWKNYNFLLGQLFLLLNVLLSLNILLYQTSLKANHDLSEPGTPLPGEDYLIETLFYQKPTDVLTSNKQWQIVSSPNYAIYLRSAFLDDRPGLDSHYVRLMAVAETKFSNLTCIFWYRHRQEPVVIPANLTFIGSKVRYSGKTFQSLLISCATTRDQCPPKWVSIADDSTVPSNMLKIETPIESLLTADFVVCVPPNHRNVSATRFIEWVETLSYLGINKVVVYDSGIFSPSLLPIVRYFAEKEKLIDLHTLTLPVNADKENSEELIRELITPAMLNECFYRNMVAHRKVIVLDFDEVIVPRISDTYPEMLSYIEERLPFPKGIVIMDIIPGFSYHFQSVFFWLDLPPMSEEYPFMTLTRYLMRSFVSHRPDTQRSITDTQVCLALGERQCTDLLPCFKNFTNWLIPINANISLLHHYRKCHLDLTYGQPGLCKKSLEMVEADAIATKFVGKYTKEITETLNKFKLVDMLALIQESLSEFNKDMDMESTNPTSYYGQKNKKENIRREDYEEEENNHGVKGDENGNAEGKMAEENLNTESESQNLPDVKENAAGKIVEENLNTKSEIHILPDQKENADNKIAEDSYITKSERQILPDVKENADNKIAEDSYITKYKNQILKEVKENAAGKIVGNNLNTKSTIWTNEKEKAASETVEKHLTTEPENKMLKDVKETGGGKRVENTFTTQSRNTILTDVKKNIRRRKDI